ncbi:MerC domain-containing protein [Fibrivirga algicola]|uniref:MerC domain-containing protein n=1 Tax=Fibrivirga algicola TaxID=2950420 RepID=A0ABX0QPX9_9BACT|nr:MerC domain-containing protein [Fibrivirga algicola]NID12648.1 MerC domain-containing protein [Fibrivirga algicola]
MKLDNVVDKKADYIGITGSVLCLIHCLTAPVLVMTSNLFRDDTLRAGFLSLDYVFIAVNIVAVYFAARQHTSSAIRTALWGFLFLFSVGLLLEDVSPFFEYIAYAASAGLVISHLFNLRQHRLVHTH